MVNLGSLPRLFAVTRPHSALAVSDLLRYTSPEQPLAWIRDDRGCVGIGEVVRLEFQGEDRFADASKAWRALSANATIDDPVGIPGSGLIAFGTFAFDDRSSARSVLIVPRTVVSVHEGRAWVTEISTRALTAEPELPARLDQGTWRGTDLATHAPDEA